MRQLVIIIAIPMIWYLTVSKYELRMENNELRRRVNILDSINKQDIKIFDTVNKIFDKKQLNIEIR